MQVALYPVSSTLSCTYTLTLWRVVEDHVVVFSMRGSREVDWGVWTIGTPGKSQVAIGVVRDRVKSANFGHQANSDSDIVCFIFQLLE